MSPLSGPDLAEAHRRRDIQQAAYRKVLAASRLNRDRWPTGLRTEVETAETAMRKAVT